MSSVYRVRTNITGAAGGRQMCTHFFDATSPNTPQAAADAVSAFWFQLKTQLSSSYTYAVDPAVETIDVTTGQPTGLATVTATSQAGTGSANFMPPATQALISWRTGFFVGGREIRGRTFIPGLAGGASTGSGVPTAGLTSAMSAAATAIITWTSSDFVVYSRAKHAQGLVTGGIPWNEFAVLRSRRD